MRGLGISPLEWLRPLVESKAWDFAVVWKYGDDPTRFMEWMGCCCGGGCNEQVRSEECRLSPICRDSQFQHPVRTKACEALAQLPYSMPLYSGVHGDVAISKQARWLIQDSIGTQVLVPIIGGLVELSTTKLIPKDIRIIELITSQCCVSMKKEAMSAWSCTPSREYYPQSWSPTPLTPTEHVAPVNQCIEGSSSGSNPSFDSNSVYLTQHEAARKSVNRSIGSKSETSEKHGNLEEDKSELMKEPQKECFISKNLVTERNRRNRIKDGLFTLRSLVPKITKMDRGAILGDAIDYIKELQEQIKGLEDETRDLGEEEEKSTTKLRRQIQKEEGRTRNPPLNELIRSCCTIKTQMEVQVQVEVNQIGRREYFIKLHYEKKRGGFARLMEAIHSFGLQVVDANIHTFDGKVLSILTVEANRQDIDPKRLREYLTEQAVSW